MQGDLVIKVREHEGGERDIDLHEGDFFVVPKGVEHKPVAAEEVEPPQRVPLPSHVPHQLHQLTAVATAVSCDAAGEARGTQHRQRAQPAHGGQPTAPLGHSHPSGNAFII